MENIEFKTPNGWTIQIRPDLTYGQFIQIQKLIASQMKVDPVTNKITSEYEGGMLFEANRKTMEFLVIKVIDPQGIEQTNVMEAIDNMPRPDGMALQEKVNEINAKAQLPKKKGA